MKGKRQENKLAGWEHAGEKTVSGGNQSSQG